jgi:hypothetical protein
MEDKNTHKEDRLALIRSIGNRMRAAEWNGDLVEKETTALEPIGEVPSYLLPADEQEDLDA